MKTKFTRQKNVWTAALQVLVFGSAMVSLSAAAQECVIKLGVAGPMTGGAAAWGIAQKGGAEFEAAWRNANGGVQVGNRKCRVTVYAVDTLQTVAGSAAASNMLASQEIKLVIGPVSSAENTGFKTVAKRNKQLHFTSTFAVDAIGPEFPLSFQNQLPPQAWGATTLKVAKERFNLKSVSLVAPNDQGGTDAGNALLKYYGEVGVKGAPPEWYQRGTMNFAPIVTRLMSQNPDAVEVGPMPPGEAGVLVRQMLEAGYKGTFARMGTGAEQLIKSAGGAQKINALYSFEAVPTEDAGIVRMNAEYERMMKTSVPTNSLLYCAQLATEQLLNAVSRAGTYEDVDKIAAELRKSTPESRYLGKGAWRGKTMYGSNQQLAFPVGLGFIVNGKKEAQRRVEVAGE
jgi:branched-chain amino acid transport system substrate-binding protein